MYSFIFIIQIHFGIDANFFCFANCGMSKEEPKPIYITVTDQHIIDSVRTIRLNLNISQPFLSSHSNPSKVDSSVGKAEGISSSHKFTDAQLHEFTKIFSAVAKEKNKKAEELGDRERVPEEYTLFDFYPPNPLPDEMVIKSKNVDDTRIFPTGAVNYIIEELDLLDIPKTTNEIAECANKLFTKKWDASDLGSPLDRAVEKGLLIKTDPPARVTYQKAKK